MPIYTGSSPTAAVSTSPDARIASLATSLRWDIPTLTYSFPAAGALWAPGYPASYAPDPPYTNATQLTPANQDQFRFAISKWADLVHMDFVEVADGEIVGDIRAMYYGTAAGYVGFAYYPGDSPWSGDVWLEPGTAYYKPGFEPGWPHPVTLMLHEIGHALGLSHPTDGTVPMPAQYLSPQYTVMRTDSIFNFPPTTPMLMDVLAIQYMYGANYSTRGGDTTYTYDEARPYHETIWDGGGSDTIEYVGARDARIDLTAGESCRLGQPIYSIVNGVRTDYDNIWIAYNVTIENARGGSGNDILIGNAEANTLDGADGRDTALYGSAHSSYRVAQSGGGFSVDGPDGSDLLLDVERVRFGDNYGIALDIDGNAGQAYRLYRAAFDRAPDLPGLGYQMNDLDCGNSLEWVASNFIASPEFLSRYGDAVDNTQFITLLYEHTLHREPDAGGLQFHLGEFAQGETRAQMLIHFSESPENQANVIGQIDNGMLYVPLA